ncbi:hypothetical protein A9Q74_09320 [Colwellia sp. 39_35_sub15_T18]|nr:hypothetical protein A9Q74_09320 [Colwellia sp. 39_35_sub15_T18]
MFDKAYRILAIDDAKDGLLLLAFDLQEAGCDVVSANSGESALRLLEQNQVDLIILDMHMPGLSGLATLAALKSNSKLQDIPVIMLSASDLEDEIVAALELGADDYVVKPYIRKVLLARMHTSLRLREKTKALAYLAKTDFLTGINNRSCFYQLTNSAMSQASRNDHNIVIAMFDIDLFKRVNDNYGHDVGDQILKAFAQCMSQCFRDYDIIGRLGGEEFAVCLPDTNIEQAMLACERFRCNIEQLSLSSAVDNQNQENSNLVKITVSGGVVSSSRKSLDIDQLLKQADVALYYAKSTGRNKMVNVNDLPNNEEVQDPAKLNQTNTSIVNTSAASIPEETLNEVDNSIDLALIDDFSLEGMEVTVGLNNVLGDKALYFEILQMFYQDHRNDGDKLKQAISEQDYDTAKHVSHTLKGVSCSVGAMTLFDLTKKLDDAINAKETDLQALLTNVDAQLKKVMGSIQMAVVKEF